MSVFDCQWVVQPAMFAPVCTEMTPVCLCLEIEHNHCIFLTWIHILPYRVIDCKLVGNCTMVTTLASTNDEVALVKFEILQNTIDFCEVLGIDDATEDVWMVTYVFT